MQNINKLKTSYSPWNFNFCDEIDGFKIEYKNIIEFSQGSPLIGNLYVNNKELFKNKFFSSPYLYFERYLYIPMFIKRFCLSGFIITKINLDTLEIHYISKIESLIYIDCMYSSKLIYYADINKEEKKEILL